MLAHGAGSFIFVARLSVVCTFYKHVYLQPVLRIGFYLFFAILSYRTRPSPAFISKHAFSVGPLIGPKYGLASILLTATMA